MAQEAISATEACQRYLGDYLASSGVELGQVAGHRWQNLSSHWLEAWFGLRLIESGILRSPSSAGEPSTPAGNEQGVQLATGHLHPERVCQLVGYWAIYFRYLLSFCIPKSDREEPSFKQLRQLSQISEPRSEEVDAAQLCLLCEWAHDQGVPRVIPLQAWLESVYPTELALYSLSPEDASHRQHLFHVQDECLLGCALLEAHITGGTLLQALAEAGGLDPTLLWRNWLVASLLHDLGYALQVIPKGISSLAPDTQTALASLIDDIKERLRSVPLHANHRDPTVSQAMRFLDLEDHAHVTIATLYQILESLGDRGRVSSDYNMALAAIIYHDAKDSDIHYRDDPLSTLIVLCDQLQDWGRPRLDRDVLSRRFMAALRHADGDSIRQSLLNPRYSSSRLLVGGGVDNGQLAFASNEISFCLRGSRAGEGGYEPIVAWVDICRAFQRIRPHGAEELPCFQVCLEHEVARDGLGELQRLGAFALKKPSERGAIMDWIRALHRGNSGMQYKADTTRESCTFFIPKLGETTPLLREPSKLYRDYRSFAAANRLERHGR